MPWAILDTGVYIAHWEGTLGAEALASIRKTLWCAILLSSCLSCAEEREQRQRSSL